MAHTTDSLARRWADDPQLTSGEQRVFRRRDLLALGVPDATLSAMLRRGLLTRVRHGVYVHTTVLESADALERHRIDAAAAIAAAEEPTWALGTTAASLHGMPLPFDVPPAVTLARRRAADERGLRRPSRHRLTLPDVRVVTGPVDESTTVRLAGVPTVGPALAAVSAATELTSSRWRTAVLDSALWRKASVETLGNTIEQWRHLGHRCELMAALGDARPGAQTVLETFSRLALLEEGLPEPELQAPFHDAGGLVGYVDLWWPGLRVVGEADGAIKYATRDDLLREKAREDRLRMLGLAVVRWTWEEITEHPEAVAARILTAARTRRHSA